MLKKRLGVWMSTFVICLSFVSIGVLNNAHATEECWVDLAAPYGVINFADAYALINGYVALGGFDFDQDGQPEFIDHNGDGTYNSQDVFGVWHEFVAAWTDAYYNGCSPDQVVQYVTPSGGEVVALDGSAAVDIPSGAMSTSTEITVTPLEDGPFTNWGEFKAYEFGPYGTQFAQPVTLRISYAGMNVENPYALGIVTYIDGEWLPVNTVGVDTVNQFVIAETSHFSTYAIALDGQQQYALGGSCSGHDEPKRLPVDGMYETCGLNGRGNIVAECAGSIWSEYPYSDHVAGPLKDEPDHICWHRPSTMIQTGQSCLDETPSADEYTCYDLDKCVDGAPDACSGHGTCTLLEITDATIEKIKVANPADFPTEVSENLLTKRWDCVCDAANNYVSDGEGNCDLECPLPRIYDEVSDSCILDCTLPHIYEAVSDSCVLECPLPHIYDAVSDSCVLDCELPWVYDAVSDSCEVNCSEDYHRGNEEGVCTFDCLLGQDPDALCGAGEICVVDAVTNFGYCEMDAPCEDLDCGENGTCEVDSATFEASCKCEMGWRGDGTHCDEAYFVCEDPGVNLCSEDVFCVDCAHDGVTCSSSTTTQYECDCVGSGLAGPYCDFEAENLVWGVYRLGSNELLFKGIGANYNSIVVLESDYNCLSPVCGGRGVYPSNAYVRPIQGGYYWIAMISHINVYHSLAVIHPVLTFDEMDLNDDHYSLLPFTWDYDDVVETSVDPYLKGTLGVQALYMSQLP